MNKFLSTRTGQSFAMKRDKNLTVNSHEIFNNPKRDNNLNFGTLVKRPSIGTF